MKTGHEKAQVILDALDRLDSKLLVNDDLWTGLAGLRDAINNVFRGTSDAAKASSFAQGQIPDGHYPASTSVDAIKFLAETLRAGKKINW